MSECTSEYATWCPIHGDCTCRREGGEAYVDDEMCPLHGAHTDHAEELSPARRQTLDALAAVIGAVVNDTRTASIAIDASEILDALEEAVVLLKRTGRPGAWERFAAVLRKYGRGPVIVRPEQFSARDETP